MSNVNYQMSNVKGAGNRLKALFILLLALWLTASTALVLVVTWNNPIAHAVVGMGTGLIVLWVFLGGGLMFLLRDPIHRFVQRIPLQWQVKFVLLATLMALIEEAVTTTMTNLAPLFGVKIGEAYITASANYLDVVLHHSVIVFVPMFVAWAVLLRWWNFSPFWVFVLFGLTGLMAEAGTFGAQHLSEFALWIFVYGLMVFLPAYTLPAERGAQPARWYHAIAAVLLPFMLAIPVAVLVGLLDPAHPDIHFPPIQG
jgi:hypothetical protein